ncbi:hypothetical protein [Legionella waltersii]|uniref:Uncharacterized protein n=1 Tax=Legionella waltersii TaxID=66969 RepID=A0A0W1ABW2_9GAMM|nr:hypothetical protein [Legionella waltersii]KTD78775.1 hypothetical protein Lwal_1545 [Legionella waltersii]SNV11204.1 Uncharacterised protein [Legionella waltersii]
MRKGRFHLMLFLFYIPIQAHSIQAVQIEDPVQAECRKEFYNQCISKCETTDVTDCGKACEQQAVNQCVEAGE